MGVYLDYDSVSDKWVITGCMFRWEYNTKEEAEADMKKASEHHWKKLKARQIVTEMLLGYRY